jgi:hypothetical protein
MDLFCYCVRSASCNRVRLAATPLYRAWNGLAPHTPDAQLSWESHLCCGALFFSRGNFCSQLRRSRRSCAYAWCTERIEWRAWSSWSVYGGANGFFPSNNDDLRLVRRGLLLFIACAAYHNVTMFVGRYDNIEPFSFVVLLVCLGAVAARRTLANEQQLTVIQKELEIAKRIQPSLLPVSSPASRRFRVSILIVDDHARLRAQRFEVVR